MVDIFMDVLEVFPRGLVYVGMGVFILVLAKVIQDFLTPYRINEQLRNQSNFALAISISGYYLGIIFVFSGALYQPFGFVDFISDGGLGFTSDYWKDVLEVFLYSLGGIVALNVARLVVDRIILYKFSTEKEIIKDQNSGAGVVEAAVYVAVGLIIAGSIAGEGGGVSTVLVFFLLGLATLVIYTLFYQFTTPFNIHDELEADNVAVGIALAGNMLAVSLIIFKAVFGNFDGWSESLIGFVTFVVIGFALLYVIRLIVDYILFPKVKLSEQIAVNRNFGLALIEGSILTCVSLVLLFSV